MKGRINQLAFVVLVLSVAGAVAQTPRELIKQLRQIKPLETTTLEVSQILYRYQRDKDGEDRERFEEEDLSIDVDYSSGRCAEDEDSDDASELWKVERGLVARIDVAFDNDGPGPKSLGLDLSKFEKERMYHDYEDSWLYHDRANGWAITTNEGKVRNIFVFPAKAKAKRLCEGLTDASAFYTRKSWFAEPLEARSATPYCPVANVESLTLSTAEISGAAADKKITVTTVARDPENDVLTYVYIVKAGQIIGKGPNVIWDLTGVAPGTYTITAGVDDGCGICGATQTMSVVVR